MATDLRIGKIHARQCGTGVKLMAKRNVKFTVLHPLIFVCGLTHSGRSREKSFDAKRTCKHLSLLNVVADTVGDKVLFLSLYLFCVALLLH